MNTVFMVSYCIGDRVSQKVQVLHISQNTSFCLRRTKFGVGLESGGVEEGRHEQIIHSKRVANQLRGAK